MKKITLCCALFVLGTIHTLKAQVKIGNNAGTINANSLLELESTNKGFVPPRVTLTSISSVSPLTGTVLEGTIVYNSGSTLSEGLYVWNDTYWKKLDTEESNPVSKTGNATLTKNETLVLVNPSGTEASIILPNITAIDNGLTITIKNVGSADDLVTVTDDGDDNIDGDAAVTLTRWRGQTFIAYNSNWIIEDKINTDDHFLEVNVNSSWTTIPEVVSYLTAHMDGPTVVRLGGETYTLSATVVIDLDYPVTFQGLSYGTASIVPHTTNLASKPMFRCKSDCYFKMLNFSHDEIGTYGDGANEDAIHYVSKGASAIYNTYNEIKDCTFDGFYNTIIDSTDAELWIFETDISDATRSGILLHSADDSAILKVAETDFINCRRGIHMDKGDEATIQMSSGGYYNTNATDTAIIYKPSTFTAFKSIAITGNTWNNSGVYVSGFDFSRSDGRDANAFVEKNAGMGDKRPNCALTLLNNASATTLTDAANWYKITWDYTKLTSTTCKWTITNASGGTAANVNRITYQPINRRDAYITITGNLLTNSNGATVNIGLVKNPAGNATTLAAASVTRYGETTLYAITGVALQFSTVVYLSDVAATDRFELWANSTTGGITVTLSDTQWLVNTQ